MCVHKDILHYQLMFIIKCQSFLYATKFISHQVLQSISTEAHYM